MTKLEGNDLWQQKMLLIDNVEQYKAQQELKDKPTKGLLIVEERSMV
ncbi:hypothetical protein [Paenibacillus sp. FSL R7-0331]|nr:hypothetical protein [Paenibacillus sp. FSL R7-0331]